MKAVGFKAVEHKGELTVVRWDATPEVIVIPAKKKGGEETKKQTDNVICTELVFRGTADEAAIREAVAKDMELRYPEGGAPEVDVDGIIAALK